MAASIKDARAAEREVMATELERRLYLNRLRRRAEQTATTRPLIADRVKVAAGIELSDADFLGLAEGDRLEERLLERRATFVPVICWYIDGVEGHVAQTLESIAAAVELEAAYLVGNLVTETAGIPLVPVRPMLENVFRYWRRNQEEFCLATGDAEDCLILGWGTPCAGYELTVWGAFERALTELPPHVHFANPS